MNMAKRGYYNGSDYVPYSEGPLSHRKVKERKERQRQRSKEKNQNHDLAFCPKCGSAFLKIHNSCPSCGYSINNSYNQRYENRIDRQRQQRIKEQETKSQMNNVLRAMRQGKTRSQAAQYSGVPLSRINHWYREGVVGTTKDTSHFYREVRSIEEDRERRERERINRQNRIDQERREHNARQERLRKQRERERQSNVKNSPSHSNNERLMDEILSLMRKGSSRSEAANSLNVNIATVNNWYNRGKRGESDYQNFYNKVKSIEDTRNRYNPTSKPKSTLTTKQSSKPKVESKNRKTSKPKTSSKYVRCSKCGKQYNKHINSQCPHCKKSNTLTKAKYCQKCGKKLNSGEVNYCSKCGASIKTGKKTYGKKSTTTKTSSKDDSSDWVLCCVAVFVVFIIMAFWGL